MRALSPSVVAATIATLCGAASPFAGDQTLLGRKFVAQDPSAGTTTDRRTIKVSAREKSSPNALVGDPTAPGSGATVDVFFDDSTSPAFSDVLPQGASPSGGAYWTGSAGSKLDYKDQKGGNGPVKKVKIKRGANGTFTAAIQMSGKHGVLPPVSGYTSMCVALTLGLEAGAERYSIMFGSDSEERTVPGRLFEAKDPQLEGICLTSTTPCGETTYPSCGGACGPGEACRPFSGLPFSFSPAGFCACVAQGGPNDCPEGTAYQVGGDMNNVPIGCSPVPTCHDTQSEYPACNGGVAPGAVCQPLRVLDFGFGANASVCVPYPADEGCASFCPGDLSGGGTCPSGQACLVSSTAEGQDCGCFTPPYCFDSLSCGGDCPDGTCGACPPALCGPSSVCLCSSD